MYEQFTLDSPHADQLAHDVPPPDGALTAEQIESRHVLVQLHREFEDTRVYADTDFIEHLMTISPEEARQIIQQERAKSEDAGWLTPNLQQYNSYVADLRKVRRDQREHIKSELQQIPEDAPAEEKRAAYLRALDHSPILASKILEKINSVSMKMTLHNPRSTKIFNDDQIKEVSANGEKFKQALKQIIIDEPTLVFKTSAILDIVASKEDIRAALDTVRETNPDTLLGYIDYALKFYNRDEAKDLIIELADKSPSQALHMIIKPRIAELLGDTEVARLAKKAVHEGAYLPVGHTLNECIAKNYVTKDEVREKVFEEFENQFSNFNASSYSSGEDPILSTEDIKMLSEKAYLKIQNGELDFGVIRNTGLLTDEQKKVLVQQRFDEDPTKTTEEHPELVSLYIEPSVAREALLLYIQNDEEKAFNRAYQILNHKVLTSEDKQAFFRRLVDKNPSTALSNLHYVNGKYGEALFSDEEIGVFVVKAFETNFESACYTLKDCAKYFEDPQILKTLIIDGIEKSESLSIFSTNNKELLDKLFTSDEQYELFHSVISKKIEELGQDANFFKYQINMQGIIEFFGDKVAKDITDQIRDVNLETFIGLLPEISYLYSKDNLTNIISDLSKTPEGEAMLMEKLYWSLFDPSHTWPGIIGKEASAKIFMAIGPEHFESIINLKDRLGYFIGENNAIQMAQQILQSNPALAIANTEFFETYIAGFSAESIIQNALLDEKRMAVVGKYLNETLTRVSKTQRDSVRDRLLVEASEVYTLIEKQIRSGTYDSAMALRVKFELNPKAERSFLETYDLIMTLGSSMDQENTKKVESIADVEHIAVQAIIHSLGVVQEVTLEQSQQILQRLGSVTPLGLYIAQYKQSAEHATVLRSLTEALLLGNYEAWKYGPITAENLESLKQKGLLPVNMSQSQYKIWQQEAETQSAEAYTVQTNAVVNEVSRILIENEDAFPEYTITNPSELAETLEIVSKNLSKTGQAVSKIHQELKTLRAQPDKELAQEQIVELERQLNELESERVDMQIQQDVLQLLSLSDEEIRVGLMRTQGDGKGRPIAQALQRLKKNTRPEMQFVTEQIDAVFDSFASQTGEMQMLRARDTASPQTTIEIGEKPLTSCQNYRNGSMNESLLGYTDPNTKILLLSNERGNPVARSIFRILSDDAGNPVLHTETIYTTDASDGVAKAIYQHALDKAEAMGIPLFISSVSQNDEGHMVGARNVEGFVAEPTDTVLSSKSSRAPFVYVDSAGGRQQGGQYSISNVSRLTLAT
jgi:uncharacterized phage-associated protein